MPITQDISTIVEAILQKYTAIDYMWARFKELPLGDQNNEALVNAMGHYDYTVNTTWVPALYNAAKYYIEGSSENGEGTEGSDRKKYIRPKHQRHLFFSELWPESELENWGTES